MAASLGRLAQLVRASALQAEGHPFEPDTAHHSSGIMAFPTRLSGNKARLKRQGTLPGPRGSLRHGYTLRGYFGDVVQLVRTHACHA